MSGNDVQLQFHGPLFDGKSDAIMKQAIKNTVRNLVQIGEDRLDERLRPKPAGVFLSVSEAKPKQHSKGNYRRRVHGEPKGARSGRIHDSNTIYGPWLEGTSSRNKTTRFKGYGEFRKTRDWIDKKQAMPIMKKHIERATRRLNGM